MVYGGAIVYWIGKRGKVVQMQIGEDCHGAGSDNGGGDLQSKGECLGLFELSTLLSNFHSLIKITV